VIVQVPRLFSSHSCNASPPIAGSSAFACGIWTLGNATLLGIVAVRHGSQPWRVSPGTRHDLLTNSPSAFLPFTELNFIDRVMASIVSLDASGTSAEVAGTRNPSPQLSSNAGHPRQTSSMDGSSDWAGSFIAALMARRCADGRVASTWLRPLTRTLSKKWSGIVPSRNGRNRSV
jgi:hypothetical protein